MNEYCYFLQSILVTLPSGHSLPDFIGSTEIKFLVWKTVQQDLSSCGFFLILTSSMEQLHDSVTIGNIVSAVVIIAD